MKRFNVKVKHDNGTFVLRVTATNEEAARKMVMDIEGCPARSIVNVKEVKAK